MSADQETVLGLEDPLTLYTVQSPRVVTASAEARRVLSAIATVAPLHSVHLDRSMD